MSKHVAYEESTLDEVLVTTSAPLYETRNFCRQSTMCRWEGDARLARFENINAHAARTFIDDEGIQYPEVAAEFKEDSIVYTYNLPGDRVIYAEFTRTNGLTLSGNPAVRNNLLKNYIWGVYVPQMVFEDTEAEYVVKLDRGAQTLTEEFARRYVPKYTPGKTPYVISDIIEVPSVKGPFYPNGESCNSKTDPEPTKAVVLMAFRPEFKLPDGAQVWVCYRSSDIIRMVTYPNGDMYFPESEQAPMNPHVCLMWVDKPLLGEIESPGNPVEEPEWMAEAKANDLARM